MHESNHNATPQDRLAIGVEEAAELLSISRSSVFALLRDGSLPGLKVGKRRLIRVQDLQAFLDRRAKEAA